MLEIKNLNISFVQGEKEANALRGISLSLKRNEVHSLVGESGSGKTVTSTCIMGLLPTPPGRINSGQIILNNQDLLLLEEKDQRQIRGKEIAMVFQEPARYLNPTLKVGDQITEMLILHLGMSNIEAVDRALEILELVGLDGGKRILDSYPHELSGGMKQRIMIAIAISCNPAFLIADEPTTALDVTLQLQILNLMLSLKNTLDMGILFISHDLRVVHDISDWVSVIYAGRIVESTSRKELFTNPKHPYTRLLLESIPDADKRGQRLQTIPGKVPDAENIPGGCAFHTRCPIAEDICKTDLPETKEVGSDNSGTSHTAACHFIGKQWKN
ncbi:MAG: methionine ABC transporter ATP-binding protein [Spirochaetes bacterium]|nr:MAG: methionine ABC transporter ATP-binding protein [Spirochaetota bacterium]